MEAIPATSIQAWARGKAKEVIKNHFIFEGMSD